MHYDEDIDCEGLLCPLPVLRARKNLHRMGSGQVLRLRATDAMAAVDLPHFCHQAGHDYLGCEDLGISASGQIRAYFIRCGGQ